ncbi:MAG TPA: protein-glutamate O-methyltransferase CheR [Terriglobia bacterium]|nr:protein-glutamate O-methyltransferase CheR [Terriglobia bacterium]
MKNELAVSSSPSVEEIEMDLLLEGIYRQYGFDFRNYALSSLRRRIMNFARNERASSISALQDRILHDRSWLDRFLYALSVNVSAFFRDPAFYMAFRKEVVPMLRTYPFIRIWLAGVSMGEEVYSLAILLQEEGIYDRCRIYATDINEPVLKKAKEGIYPLELMQTYTSNYIKSGGLQSFSRYYTAAYDRAIFKASLRDNVVFAQHNLASDASFNEFHVILCRNVMIYFNNELQAHVHHLLYESLVMFGILGVGAKETLRFSPHEQAYEEIDKPAKLYRRVA